jgi:hypothetical protein
VTGRLNESEGDAEQAERDSNHADDVERAAFGVAGLGHGRVRDDEPGQRERHIDPEHRGPAEDRKEGSTHDRTKSEAEAGDGRPHTEGARPALHGIGLGQDGERQGGHEGATRSLEGSGPDEGHIRGRQRACDGAEREDDHARQEEALPPEAVAQCAPERDKGGQRQRIGTDHPLELPGGHVQLALNRRQRCVDDGDVEQCHALRHAHGDQGQAAAARQPRVLASGRVRQSLPLRIGGKASESCVNLPAPSANQIARGARSGA